MGGSACPPPAPCSPSLFSFLLLSARVHAPPPLHYHVDPVFPVGRRQHGRPDGASEEGGGARRVPRARGEREREARESRSLFARGQAAPPAAGAWPPGARRASGLAACCLSTWTGARLAWLATPGADVCGIHTAVAAAPPQNTTPPAAAACVRVWRPDSLSHSRLSPRPLPSSLPSQAAPRAGPSSRGALLVEARVAVRRILLGVTGEREGRARIGRAAARPHCWPTDPPPPHTPLPHHTPTPTQIRFQRFGRKKAPFYRLVAIDSRDRREGRPLEVRESAGKCAGRGVAIFPPQKPRRPFHPSIPLIAHLSPLSFHPFPPTAPGLLRPPAQGDQPERARHQEVAGPGRPAVGDGRPPAGQGHDHGRGVRNKKGGGGERLGRERGVCLRCLFWRARGRGGVGGAPPRLFCKGRMHLTKK